MDGLQMEVVITRLIEDLGFECPRPRQVWGEGELYEYARQVAPEHLELNIRGGVVRRLSSSDDWGILDRVYKVDLLVRQYTGELWGLQFTSNLPEVERKQKSLRGTHSLRRGVGIHKTALVTIIPPGKTWGGLGLTSRSDYERLEGELYDLFESVEGNVAELQLDHVLDLNWLR